jgi:glycosyltransferase involved in cell wall biosynthesis
MVRLLIISGIYPPEIGGAASYAKLLIDELPKRGIAPEVLTYGSGSEKGAHYVSRRWPKGLRHCVFFLAAIRHGRKADILLSADSSFGAAFIGAWAARLLKKKFVVRVTGDYAWEQGMQRFGVTDLMDEFSAAGGPASGGQKKSYGFFVELLRKCQLFSVSQAAIVIAPSVYIKRIVNSWGVPQEKIRVVYNAVELPATSISKSESRERLGLSGRVIVSAGRLVPWKGFDMLIDVVVDVQNDFKDVKLVIIGDGPEKEKLEVKRQTSGVNDYVLFTGALPKTELSYFLRAADLFVLNTAYEGLSHQIIEAMSMGVPVVTTDVGGNPEVITDNRDGILVPYNDRRALASAIRTLLKDESKRGAIGQAAQKSRPEFSKEHMIAGLVSVIHSL